MPLFRRRPADPARERLRAAFRIAATHVDIAQRALIAAVPTARDPGVPLADALSSFEHHLEDADAAMDAWRDRSVMHEWTKCHEAVTAGRRAASALRHAGPLGFEVLNARIGEVIGPLEAFVDASIALRDR